MPGRNFGCDVALICIGSPVRGLRPVDALRRVTEKLPNPTRRTSSPFLSALVTPVVPIEWTEADDLATMPPAEIAAAGDDGPPSVRH